MIGNIKEVMDMFNNTYTDHKEIIYINWVTQEEIEDAHGETLTPSQYLRVLNELERYGSDSIQYTVSEAIYQILGREGDSDA
jgi:hypothetical protein